MELNIKCSVCGTVYGRGREKCPRCYGIACKECLHPIYRWEDLHRTGTGTIHGRCVDGPRDPELPNQDTTITIITKPIRQSAELMAWVLLRSNGNEHL